MGGPLGPAGERHPAVPHRPAFDLERDRAAARDREQVVVAPEAVEPELVDPAAHRHQLVPADVLAPDLEADPDAHDDRSRIRRSASSRKRTHRSNAVVSRRGARCSSHARVPSTSARGTARSGRRRRGVRARTGRPVRCGRPSRSRTPSRSRRDFGCAPRSSPRPGRGRDGGGPGPAPGDRRSRRPPRCRPRRARGRRRRPAPRGRSARPPGSPSRRPRSCRRDRDRRSTARSAGQTSRRCAPAARRPPRHRT